MEQIIIMAETYIHREYSDELKAERCIKHKEKYYVFFTDGGENIDVPVVVIYLNNIKDSTEIPNEEIIEAFANGEVIWQA